MKNTSYKKLQKTPAACLSDILSHLLLVSMLLLIMIAAKSGLRADEGMWTFDNPPLGQLKSKYGFEPTKQWLGHIRLSSLRFPGGTGSFVGKNGLAMTNYHVVARLVERLSTEKNDYRRNGFYAEDMEDELVLGIELYLLQSMTNVTSEMHEAIDGIEYPADAERIIKNKTKELERFWSDSTKLRSKIVKLYEGGEYWIYSYKIFNDVRLVFSPDHQAAFFGGNYDNFIYPSYDLDVAFVRVYDNGKPYQPEHYLAWNSYGPAEGELVFASGNPGSTERHISYDHLLFHRDYPIPLRRNQLKYKIDILKKYAQFGKWEKEEATSMLFYTENAFKVKDGQLTGLANPDVLKIKKATNVKLKAKVNDDPVLDDKYGDLWHEISSLLAIKSGMYYQIYNRTLSSKIYSLGRNLYTYLNEMSKPEDERYESFSESGLNKMKTQILRYGQLNRRLGLMNLKSNIIFCLEVLGKDDEFMELILEGQTPEIAAKRLFDNSKLADLEFRTRILNGGIDALNESGDPILKIIKAIEPERQEKMKWFKENVDKPLEKLEKKLTEAKFAAFGKSQYPDANFTLRLSYGLVKGYPVNGTIAPYKTTLYGLFDRAASFDNKDEFELPAKYWELRDVINLSTPANFVTTCDMVGGSSGSPVVNKEAEVVGILFDGNIETTPNHYVYDPSVQRGLAVHTAYIIEALRNIFDAGELADELEAE